ncbi:MAG: DNA translocase FtsK [Clostridia bacterium]|nr:DNA translocase FtsK [Clostridia bacterium]
MDFGRRNTENEDRGREEEIVKPAWMAERERETPITREPERVVEPVKHEEPKKVEPPKPRVIKPYKRVPLDDFDCRDNEPAQNEEEVEETKETIIATLEDFKVTGATIASVTFGPTVTRYNVALPRSVSPRKIMALDQSIAINLHSSGVNIYPNYEDGVVSIEVPNKERQFVKIGCMLSGNTFVNAPSSSLMFTMGKNVANTKIYGDISKMIHMLVAGSSGSGKSVFLGSLIISLIYKYSPEELRLILIDPKKTEFVLYNDLPHLMINEIITDVNKTIQTLNWAIGEMNHRYDLFEQMSRAGQYVVNLDEYNSKLEKNQRLPKIVIIIDELADLMLAAKKEMEDRIQNLTQKARAAGIHLIVATQRPSTDVITGVIKSNLATRIAFYVASDVDSRVILDQSGAQKLLGKGDMLYTMPGINTPVRVQSAFISPEDSQKVVNFIKANNEAYYDEEATAFINNTRTGDDDGLGATSKADVDPMCIEALRHVILSGSASISMIQRKCSAGYNRAGRIIEWMEEMGYISAFDGAKARKVLITKEDFESIYGPL